MSVFSKIFPAQQHTSLLTSVCHFHLTRLLNLDFEVHLRKAPLKGIYCSAAFTTQKTRNVFCLSLNLALSLLPFFLIYCSSSPLCSQSWQGPTLTHFVRCECCLLPLGQGCLPSTSPFTHAEVPQPRVTQAPLYRCCHCLFISETGRLSCQYLERPLESGHS